MALNSNKRTTLHKSKNGARFPVRRILLYGSRARGTAGPASDIDIAIVFEREPDDVLSTEAELYRLGWAIDLRIEPVLVSDTEDPSGFWKNIVRYGKEIPPANVHA